MTDAAAGGLGERERVYDLGELARLVSVHAAVVRSWLDRGLLQPCRQQGRMPFFDFRAVAAARTLQRFHAAGWNAARIERGLAAARKLCSDEDAARDGLLASLGRGRLTVRLPDGRLVEPGGQQLFDFAAGEPAAAAGKLHDLRQPRDWFRLGIEAEAEGRLHDAVRAYERALPGDAAVHFNLGNCRYQLGDKQAAAQQFAAAVDRDPDYAEAWNNLGIAHGDLGDLAGAVAAFRQALRIVPHYGDAHFNLAEVLADSGDLDGARRHWRAYLSHDPNSRSAELVRRRLQKIDDGRDG